MCPVMHMDRCQHVPSFLTHIQKVHCFHEDDDPTTVRLQKPRCFAVRWEPAPNDASWLANTRNRTDKCVGHGSLWWLSLMTPARFVDGFSSSHNDGHTTQSHYVAHPPGLQLSMGPVTPEGRPPRAGKSHTSSPVSRCSNRMCFLGSTTNHS